MKSIFGNFAVKIATLIGIFVLVSCGGTDTNDRVSLPANHIATCKLLANWDMLEIGLTRDNVERIIGKAATSNITSTGIADSYSFCDTYLVETTSENTTTPEIDRVVTVTQAPGYVSYKGGTDGYVSEIKKPAAISEPFFHKLSEDEELNGNVSAIIAALCPTSAAKCSGGSLIK